MLVTSFSPVFCYFPVVAVAGFLFLCVMVYKLFGTKFYILVRRRPPALGLRGARLGYVGPHRSSIVTGRPFIPIY